MSTAAGLALLSLITQIESDGYTRVLMLLSGGSSAYVVVSLVASLMVLWRHRSNIERLLAGTEPKIGQKS